MATFAVDPKIVYFVPSLKFLETSFNQSLVSCFQVAFSILILSGIAVARNVRLLGATTLSIMTSSITTFSGANKNVTLNVSLGIQGRYAECQCDECNYVEFH